MVIKRKLFTRAEKAMWREIRNATNRFRELPKNYRCMTPRDKYRLSNIAGIDAATPEDLKNLATHLGLPETAKTGYKVLKKYNNPELIERYNRIRAHKLGLGKETSRVGYLDKKIKELQEKANKFINYGEGTVDEYAEYIRKIDKYDTEKQALLTTINNALGEANGKKIKSLIPFINDQINRGRRASLAIKESVVNDPVLANKLRSRFRKKNNIIDFAETVDPEALGTHLRYSKLFPEANSGIVYKTAAEKFDPATVGHEFGHFEENQYIKRASSSSGLQFRARRDRDQRPLYDLGNEYAASARALAAMKSGSVLATPKQIADAEKQLTECYKTYYHDVVPRTAWSFHSKNLLQTQ